MHSPPTSHPDAEHALDADPSSGSDLHRLDGLRVLLVDDDEQATDALLAVLQSCGAEVHSAHSAVEALAVMIGWHPDVVLTDIAMPDGSGYDLLRHIRALPGPLARIPIVASSACAPDAQRAAASRTGFERYLRKPVDLAELTRALATVGGLSDVEQ